MRILVTGAQGFIGKNVSDYLMSCGYQVIRTDVRGEKLQGDITDDNFVFSRIASEDFQAIIHLAAITEIPDTIADPQTCFKINCFGTLKMLELATRKSVKRFIYASSANVYGAPKKNPVTEDDPFDPRTPYDYSKVTSEFIVKSYNQNRGLPTVILRSWKLFGEHDLPTKAIPRFISACLENKPIILYNEGKDSTDPYHIANYCHAVHLALENQDAVGEAFNVGTGNELTVKEIAQIIRKITESNSEIKGSPPRSSLESQPQRSTPSIEKIRKKLGYRPKINFEDGIKRTISWISGQPRLSGTPQ